MADSGGSSRRLDSWKAIAEYLKRTERTVRRWELDLGLPVRRVSDERGRSVFAYTTEIDEWLKSTSPRTMSDAGPAPAATTPSTDASGPATRRWPLRREWAAGAAAAAVLLGSLWWLLMPGETRLPLRVDFRPDALVAFDEDGQERWRYRFVGEEAALPTGRHGGAVDVVGGTKAAVLTAVALYVDRPRESIRSGQLLQLSSQGKLQRTFAFDEALGFSAGKYEGPWVMTDFRVHGESDRQIAIAAHHAQWWPSIVTVLDDRWQRRGTFVHAGWVERLHWLSADRLLITGFSNALDGGMVALLDANALDGQSPEPASSDFYCEACGSGRPLRYVVMPRSEINLVTSSRFNRAAVQSDAGGVVVRTIEAMPGEADAVDALYEFSPSLELRQALFSERYWDLHRALEREGKLDHTREMCPDRDGPRQIHVWEPVTGWRRVAAR